MTAPSESAGTWVVESFDAERDLEGVLAVDQASFVNHWTRDMVLREVRHSPVSRIFVCRAEGEVVGYCATWLLCDEIHINNLAVLPAWRRRGIGRTLLTHVLRVGRQQGARRATLEVRESNQAALALYHAVGFVVCGRRPRYYTNPVEDALILWLESAPGVLETPGPE